MELQTNKFAKKGEIIYTRVIDKSDKVIVSRHSNIIIESEEHKIMYNLPYSYENTIMIVEDHNEYKRLILYNKLHLCPVTGEVIPDITDKKNAFYFQSSYAIDEHNVQLKPRTDIVMNPAYYCKLSKYFYVMVKLIIDKIISNTNKQDFKLSDVIMFPKYDIWLNIPYSFNGIKELIHQDIVKIAVIPSEIKEFLSNKSGKSNILYSNLYNKLNIEVYCYKSSNRFKSYDNMLTTLTNESYESINANGYESSLSRMFSKEVIKLANVDLQYLCTDDN